MNDIFRAAFRAKIADKLVSDGSIEVDDAAADAIAASIMPIFERDLTFAWDLGHESGFWHGTKAFRRGDEHSKVNNPYRENPTPKFADVESIIQALKVERMRVDLLLELLRGKAAAPYLSGLERPKYGPEMQRPEYMRNKQADALDEAASDMDALERLGCAPEYACSPEENTAYADYANSTRQDWLRARASELRMNPIPRPTNTFDVATTFAMDED